MRLPAFALLLAVGIACIARGADGAGFRSNGVDYVSLDERAAQLGLRIERALSASSIILKEGARPVAHLIDRSRETNINGLRVFLGDAVLERKGLFYMSRADYEFHLLPRLRPDLCGPLPRQPHVIVVDAGHGGMDHGTENPRLRSMEKTYTLDVALRLRRLLEHQGYKVMMIREGDQTVPLENRSDIANKWSPDLFVSIHFNSLFPNTKTTGVEVMEFPSQQQRSTDSWSPGKRDDSDLKGSPINAFSAWNTVLGSQLHRRLLEALHDGDRGEKFEHLRVLRGLNCPGVLVEPAFLSSDAEGARLATPAFRDTIAASILAGIQDYGEVLRRLRPAPPPAPTPAAGPAAGHPTGTEGHTLPRRPSAGS